MCSITEGVITLAPLNFGVAGGNLVSYIQMNSRQSPIVTAAEFIAKGLHLNQLFPDSALAAEDTGTMGGRAKLIGHGNSVARMLATANGESALIMDGGSVGELMLRLSNLDIANSSAFCSAATIKYPFVAWLAISRPSRRFHRQGLGSRYRQGQHCWQRQYQLQRRIHSSPAGAGIEGFSLASLRGPIAVSGSFKIQSCGQNWAR
ncbi:MAG: AsmA family protein [Dechloromonas sp.]|uniref:AsmA family protein n=1 Tax=Candidatus Dechloromonas phosphorivorans TaxID=2899244 RepID=A0A935JVD5_9RHOO|nr:AsmA family protein [Candidatus Dechloromonas phosphorivorans]